MHDVIVYGATGFTGRLVAQYLARKADLPPARWALAGRDPRKLAAVRERLAADDERFADLAIYQADAADAESLADMAVRTKVVLTTVGPYDIHGRPLVAACVQHGTDYVDLTGEPQFWRDMIAEHHAAAEKSGALIVSCCGIDSIPHDIGAWLVVQALRSHGAPIEIDGFVAASGLPSGGTWQSAMGIFASGHFRDAEVGRPHFSEVVSRWVFPMPTIDPLVVARSGELDGYGDGFRYRAWWETKSRLQLMALMAGFRAAVKAMSLAPVRSVVASMRPSGAGPSPEQRERGWFRVKVVGRAGGATATAVMSGGDPGYGETAKMSAESALCLAQEREALPRKGGVVTPATAMGQKLVDRLRAAGMVVTVTGP